MQEQIRQVLELVRQPAFFSKDNQILWCNSPAREFLSPGMRLEELGSRPLPPLQEVKQTLRLAISIGSDEFEATVEPMDGGLLFLLQRNRQENRAIASAVMSASASLRPPLQSLLGAAEALFEQIGPMEDPALQKSSAQLNRSLYRLLRLCGQMSDGGKLILRQYPVHRAPTDLTALLQRFARQAGPLALRRQVELLLELPAEELRADVDGALLERALYNLLANSLRYTPAGGSIRLRAEKQRRELLLSFRDSGEGIAREQLAQAFERSAQQSLGDPRRGLGFGLAMVQQIARAHEGSLTLSRAEEGGTLVELRISLAPAPLELHSRSLRMDYCSGFHHGLVELAEVLDPELYLPGESGL